MEFQTNKGTLMLSSVSANIITQLGYLQNYAMKGHFLTSEIALCIRCFLIPARASLCISPYSAYKQNLCMGLFSRQTYRSQTSKSLGGIQVFLPFL